MSSDRHHNRPISSVCSFSTVFEKVPSAKYDSQLNSFWIASFSITESISALAHHWVVLETLDRDLRRFWEIEEVPEKAPRISEEHPVRTSTSTSELHSRTPEGRYIVQLPFKNGSPISISESRSIAVSSFCRLEQRLIRDPIIASENFSNTKHSVIWKTTDGNCQTRANLFRITLSYVTTVQPPAYE